jgi:retron-type reverse transcriptase
MEEWTEILDNGGTLDSIYMDFMKAFDKVPHKRLLRKLRSYGLSEQIIKWVEDFLSDRSQKVSVNNSESRDRPVTSGIPQGSVLGPILFVIYINDVPECVNASTYIIADDTKIYKEISCEDDVSGLQADLDQLQKWSDTWLLKFHSNKCKVMTVSNKTKLENKSSYHLYNNEGEEVELEM